MAASSTSVANGQRDGRRDNGGVNLQTGGMNRSGERIDQILKMIDETPIQNQQLVEHTDTTDKDESAPVHHHHHHGSQNTNTSKIPNSSIATTALEAITKLADELKKCQAINEKQGLELEAKEAEIEELKKKISLLETRDDGDVTTAKIGQCELSEPMAVGEISSASTCTTTPTPSNSPVINNIIDIDTTKSVMDQSIVGQSSSSIKDKASSGSPQTSTTTAILHAVDESRAKRGFYCSCGLKFQISLLETRDDGVVTTAKIGPCELSEPIAVGEISSASTCTTTPTPSNSPVINNIIDIDTTKSVMDQSTVGQPSSSNEEKASSGSPQTSTTTAILHAVDESRAKRGFYCSCGLKFQSRATLRSHLIYHSEKKKFPCKILCCGERFIAASYLRTHLRVKHKVKMGKFVGCRDCGALCNNKRELMVHRKQEHSTVSSQKDVTTEQAIPFPTPLSLSPAAKKLTPAGTTNCTTTADAVVVTPVESSVDKVVVLPSSSPAEPVQQQPTSSQFVDELIQMSGPIKAKTHETDKAKRHLGAYCTCGKLCASKLALSQHIWYRKYQHRLSCTICQRTFPGFSYLHKHMYSAHKMLPAGNSAIPVAPPSERLHHQDKSSNTSNKLPTTTGRKKFLNNRRSAHKKRVLNSNTNPTSKRPYEKHGVVEFVDLESEPSSSDSPGVSSVVAPPHQFFHCKCGRVFLRERELISHIKSRYNEKPFKCEYCLHRFLTHCGLKKHIRNFHNRIAHQQQSQSAFPSSSSVAAADGSSLKITSVRTLTT